MYDFQNANFYCENYWQKLSNAIDEGELITTHIRQNAIDTIGQLILERSDLVLIDEIMNPSSVKEACITVLTRTLIIYSHESQAYLQQTFKPGLFSYQGIFATEDDDVKKMWNMLAIMYKPDVELEYFNTLIPVILRYPEGPQIVNLLTQKLMNGEPLVEAYLSLSTPQRRTFKEFQKLDTL